MLYDDMLGGLTGSGDTRTMDDLRNLVYSMFMNPRRGGSSGNGWGMLQEHQFPQMGGLGMGAGPAPGTPTQRDVATADGSTLPSSPFRRMGQGFNIPTKICPTCNGTGKVPDMRAIKERMGIGQSMGYGGMP